MLLLGIHTNFTLYILTHLWLCCWVESDCSAVLFRPPPPTNWSECPHYSSETPNECFFNETYTSVWTYYNVQLRSRDRSVLYDEIFFHVQDIGEFPTHLSSACQYMKMLDLDIKSIFCPAVQPDPPVSLNWTLLNMSQTGTYYDIMLNWKPPQSADVEMGWMTLQYEVQYRDVNSDLWEAVSDLNLIYTFLSCCSFHLVFESCVFFATARPCEKHVSLTLCSSNRRQSRGSGPVQNAWRERVWRIQRLYLC